MSLSPVIFLPNCARGQLGVATEGENATMRVALDILSKSMNHPGPFGGRACYDSCLHNYVVKPLRTIPLYLSNIIQIYYLLH